MILRQTKRCCCSSVLFSVREQQKHNYKRHMLKSSFASLVWSLFFLFNHCLLPCTSSGMQRRTTTRTIWKTRNKIHESYLREISVQNLLTHFCPARARELTLSLTRPVALMKPSNFIIHSLYLFKLFIAMIICVWALVWVQTTHKIFNLKVNYASNIHNDLCIVCSRSLCDTCVSHFSAQQQFSI